MAAYWIQTYGGRVFPWAMSSRRRMTWADMTRAIYARDVAHALSQLCRFTGHTLRFFSVAEHCCRVAQVLHEEHGNKSKLALMGLLHDAAEAYTNDLAGPLLVLHELDGYREVEREVTMAVQAAFGLTPTGNWPAAVHEADLRMLATECAQVMRTPHPKEWNLPVEPYEGMKFGGDDGSPAKWEQQWLVDLAAYGGKCLNEE